MQLSTKKHIPIKIKLFYNAQAHLLIRNSNSDNKCMLLRVPFYPIEEIYQIKIKPALLTLNNHQKYQYHEQSLDFLKTSVTLNETVYS